MRESQVRVGGRGEQRLPPRWRALPWRRAGQSVFACVGGVALGGVTLACSGGEANSDCQYLFNSTAQLTIATWWQTPNHDSTVANEVDDLSPQDGEVLGATALEQGHDECGGGKSALENVQASGKQATITAIEQQAAELRTNPDLELRYDAGITNGGADIFRLGCRGEPALEPLGTVAKPIAAFLGERTPPGLASLVSCPDGTLYGVILGLHRLNQLFYNEQTLSQRELGGWAEKLAEGSSVEDLFELLEQLRSKGIARPFVVENNDWSWSLLTIENLMVATAGRPAYESFWGRLDRRSARSPEQEPNAEVDFSPLEKTLEAAARLASHILVVDGPEELHEALACKSDDHCGIFFATGDWAAPSQPAEIKAGPFPGTADSYVYTADVAVVTRRAERLDITDPVLGWLKAVSSSFVQDRYCADKNCLSALTSENGVTRAKTSEELFPPGNGQPVGVGGLPSYVPHESFNELGTKIQGLLGNAATLREGGDATFEQERDELTAYVHEQYCKVLRANGEVPENCPKSDKPVPR